MEHVQGRIKFYCRSFNKELYLLSKQLYVQAGYPCVRLTDQSADGYFYTMLRDTDCDIAINVDEDCFITDLEAVLELAGKVEQEQLINAGPADIQPACPRTGCADVTNPFFNVLNLKLIRTQWNEKQLVPAFQKDKFLTPEPYYNFFLWTVKAFPGKTLYVSGKRHTGEDKISTCLYTEQQKLFCMHSWFARQFKSNFLNACFEGNDRKDVNHPLRINALIDEAYRLRNLERPSFSLVQRIGFKCDTALRWMIKIPQRLSNYPKKWSQRRCPK